MLLEDLALLYVIVGVPVGASVWVHELRTYPLPRPARAVEAAFVWPFALLVAVLLPLRALWRVVFPPPRMTRETVLPELQEAESRVAAAAKILHEAIQAGCPPSRERVTAVENLDAAQRAARAAIYTPRP